MNSGKKKSVFLATFTSCFLELIKLSKFNVKVTEHSCVLIAARLRQFRQNDAGSKEDHRFAFTNNGPMTQTRRLPKS